MLAFNQMNSARPLQKDCNESSFRFLRKKTQSSIDYRLEKYQKRSKTRRQNALAVVSLTKQGLESKEIAGRLKIQPYEVPILRKEATQHLDSPPWKISFLESGPRAKRLFDQATTLLEQSPSEKQEVTKEFLIDFINGKYGSLDEHRSVGKLTLIGVRDWVESQNPKQYGWKKPFLEEVPEARELLEIADKLARKACLGTTLITKEFVAKLVLEEDWNLKKYPNIGLKTIASAQRWAESQKLGYPDWKKSFLENVCRGKGLLKHAVWSFRRNVPEQLELTEEFLVDFVLGKYEPLHMFGNIGQVTIANARQWAETQRKGFQQLREH